MAWTITETIEAYDRGGELSSPVNAEVIRIKLACTSDGSGTDYDITNIKQINGWFLQLVKTVPAAAGDAPAGVYTLDIEDDTDAHLMDLDNRATDATEFAKGSVTLGVFPAVFGKLSVVVATLGDGKKNTIYLFFTKQMPSG